MRRISHPVTSAVTNTRASQAHRRVLRFGESLDRMRSSQRGYLGSGLWQAGECCTRASACRLLHTAFWVWEVRGSVLLFFTRSYAIRLIHQCKTGSYRRAYGPRQLDHSAYGLFRNGKRGMLVSKMAELYEIKN